MKINELEEEDRNLLQLCVDAGVSMLATDGSINPHAIATSSDAMEYIPAINFNSVHDKDQFVKIMRAAVIAHDMDRIAFVSECWALYHKGDGDFEAWASEIESIADKPDRIEVLNIVLESENGHYEVMLKIKELHGQKYLENYEDVDISFCAVGSKEWIEKFHRSRFIALCLPKKFVRNEALKKSAEEFLEQMGASKIPIDRSAPRKDPFPLRH